MNSISKLLQLIITITCVVIFCIVCETQWEFFAQEPTGSSLKSKSMDALPFPAISICDSNFEYRRGLQDLDIPMNPFQTPR